MQAQHRPTYVTAAAALLAGLALALPDAADAQRQSGIQLTPDSATYIISKDVGDERWAITFNLDRRVVIGNVFPLDGGPPSFLYCRITQVDQAPNPADTQYHMDCQFAQSCAEAPCVNQWGEPFPVPPTAGSFFLPTGTKATLSGNVQPIYNTSCATSAVCHGNGAEFVVLANNVSWANTFRVESNGPNGMQGPFIAPFDPDGSFLFDKLGDDTVGERMPYNGSALPADQINTIRDWILEGAANN
jgi:hypothetical protein